MEQELITMNLIVKSGESRSLAFNALKEAKAGNLEKAKELQKSSNEKSIEAHNIQTELIQREAGGENVEIKLLMIHAQDHLMTSILAKELIEELISVHEKINGLSGCD